MLIKRNNNFLLKKFIKRNKNVQIHHQSIDHLFKELSLLIKFKLKVMEITLSIHNTGFTMFNNLLIIE